MGLKSKTRQKEPAVRLRATWLFPADKATCRTLSSSTHGALAPLREPRSSMRDKQCKYRFHSVTERRAERTSEITQHNLLIYVGENCDLSTSTRHTGSAVKPTQVLLGSRCRSGTSEAPYEREGRELFPQQEHRSTGTLQPGGAPSRQCAVPPPPPPSVTHGGAHLSPA